MKASTRLTLVVVTLLAAGAVRAEDVLVYTAHQEWSSRIYVVRQDGSSRYFHYDYYRLCDLTVVDGEVYVADAYAPRAFRVDLDTGELHLAVDDISLYYFYGLAFDGRYFYVKEWDLRRYDVKGNFAGRAPFPDKVFGAAWDGRHLWTVNDKGLVKCWNLSHWPTVTEVATKTFVAPSPHCKGLWFDGECFWSAEDVEGRGLIFCFDRNGHVVKTFREPSGCGWAAVTLRRPGRG